jgi:MFS family permease
VTISVDQRRAVGVLALCTVMNILSRGIGDSFAVFLLPVAREFDAERASLTGVYSTYMLVLGLMSPVAGWAIDRLGPRRCYGVGLALFGATCALASQVHSVWQLYLLTGVFGAIGGSLIGSVTASSLASRWFSTRLPTAMGILSAALGTGMLLIAPLAQWLVEHLGWRGAYQVLGVGLLALWVPLMLLPWRVIAAGTPAAPGARAPGSAAATPWTHARALRTPLFWSLTGILFFTAISTYAISVQLVACLIESGFSPMQAASTYGLVGMLSIVGMLGAGALAERFGERRVALLSYSATIAGLAMLALAARHASLILIGAFVVLFGTMQGSRGPLVAVLAARNFPGAMGRVYGMVMLGMGAGAAIGSWASGTLYDLTGGYVAGFGLSAACAIAGLAIFWTIPALADRPGAAARGVA